MADTPTSRGSQGRLELLAQIGSLVATAWLVGNLASLPRAAFAVPASMVWRAAGFTLLAWLWSAAIALVLQFAIHRVEHVDISRATLRTSSVAIWFAPATLLLYRFSLATVVAALVLVVNATRLLYTQWRIVHPADEPIAPWSGTDILRGEGAMPPPTLSSHFGPALAISLGLQMGFSAALFHDHFVAGAVLSLSVAMLTVLAVSAGAWETSRLPSLPRSIFGALLTAVLAVSLTIVATGGGSRRGAGGGEGDEASSPPLPGFFVGRESSPGPTQTGATEQARGSAANAYSEPEDTDIPGAGDLPGSVPGVILWPEIKPVTVLIAPMPATPSAFAAAAHPYGIPFGGEYWFFRPPLYRPPARSFRRRGSPASLSFSTTDHWPLKMEAHQKLEPAVELSCCSRIELAIGNADRYPNTVSLELILHDLPGRELQSLGSVPVLSQPKIDVDPIVPVAETLSFAVPAEPRVRVFNELTVVYRRDRSRADKSARVSIERFILVPRGR